MTRKNITILLLFVCFVIALNSCSAGYFGSIDDLRIKAEGKGDNESGSGTEFTVTFYDEGSQIPALTKTVEYGSEIDLDDRSKGGWTMAGWQIDGKGKGYNGKFIVTRDIEFHTKWLFGDWTRIESATQLNEIRNDPSGDYVLLDDVSLEDYNTGAGWEPIDNFSGSFDGNGYKIFYVFIFMPATDNVGFFGAINSGSVYNLGVEIAPAGIKGQHHVGGIAGYIKPGCDITNCYSTGNIEATGSGAGGIAGYMDTGSKIIDSYSTVNVIAGDSAGGIAGYMATATISNCYSTGSITVNIDKAGGIAGSVGPGSAINNCVAINLTIAALNHTGRIIGFSSNNLSNSTVLNNFALEVMTGTGASFNTDPKYHGGDKTAADLRTPATYSTVPVLGWKFGDTDATPWKWGGASYPLPVLYWQEVGSYPEFPPQLGGGDVFVSTTDETLSNDADTFGLVATSVSSSDISIASVEINSGKIKITSVSIGSAVITVSDSSGHEATVAVTVSNTGAINIGTIVKYEDTDLGSGSEENPFKVSGVTTLGYVGGGTNNPEGYKDWTLDKYYEQTANIILPSVAAGASNWQRIGNTTAPFTGTYNGNGHTITGLTIDASANYQGMFCYINATGVVKNLGLINVNIKNSGTNTGGVAGLNVGRVENCYVSGSITSTFTNLNAVAGGVAGDNNGGTITGCYTTVTITGAGGSIGGVAGNNNTGSTVSNCIALNYSVTTTGNFSTIRRVAGNSTGTMSNNYAWTSMTVRYNTNTNQSINAGSTTTDGVSLTTVDSKTKTAWDTAGFLFTSSTPTAGLWVWNNESGMPSFANSAAMPWPEHLSTSAGGGTEGDPFLVRNATELGYAGRGTANPSGYEDWTLTAHYKQAANITLSGNWIRIGGENDATGFKGSYNGDGYTINGLTIDAAANWQGMFGCISTTGVVKNLGLLNVNIKNSAWYTGSLAGRNEGRVENCYTTGSITGNSSQYNSNTGGVVSNNTGTLTCCFTTVTIFENRGYTCGVAGYNSGTVSNCIALNNSVITKGSDGTRRVVGYLAGTLINNYAWSGMDVRYNVNTDGTDGTLQATTSSATGVDGVNLSEADAKTKAAWETAGFLFTDSIPTAGPWVWNGSGGMPSLNNSAAQDWPEHLGIGIAGNPFLVTSEAELKKIGTAVDGWTVMAHYKLMTNITMTAPEAGSSNWTRIGRDNEANGFRGVFDGNGHTITGLTIDVAANWQGMFGWISTTGVVKNLGLINVNIKNSAWYTGSLAGRNEGRVENCYTTGSITGNSSQYNSNTGGVVSNNTGTLTCCFTTVTIFENQGYTGGVAGYNGGILSNCIALNNSVITIAYNGTRRVVGYLAGTLSNNYAWNDMDVRYNVNTDGTDGSYNTIVSNAAGVEGADLTAEDSKTRDAWETAGFLFTDSIPTAGPWVWNGEGGMPSLNNSAAQDWPGYLAISVGTEQNPYLINTEQDLASLARAVNAGYGAASAVKYYKLMNDLNLSGYSAGGGWIPIGTGSASPGQQFQGDFNGNGKVIRNLTINRTTNFQALFGGVLRGTVRNLSVEGTVTGSSNVAGIAGWVDRGSIINCSSSVTVTGTGSGNAYIGGIAGSVDNGSIKDCSSIGTVGDGISDRIGGIAGYLGDSKVTNCFSTGAVSGNNCVGGVVGMSYGANGSSVTNCFATGAVSGVGSIGGVVGDNSTNYANASKITNCYATGNVSGGSNRSVGGVAGSSMGIITNCYATGEVRGDDNIGGINGSGGSAVNSIANCAALNLSIERLTGTSSNYGRVSAYNGFSNNVAWTGMQALGGITFGAGAANNKDGADISAGTATTQATYSGTGTNQLGWNFGNDDDNPWKWGGDDSSYTLPVLYWQVPGNYPAMPGHLD